MSLHRLSVTEAVARLARREISARAILESCLARVDRVDGRVQAFLSLDREDALRQAEAADRALAAGTRHKDRPLLGVPIALKDVLAVKGQPLTCASRILEGYRSPYDATVVELLRNAGAVLFGRLNLDEFAMGSSTENSAWQVTRNPWDLGCSPGGVVGRFGGCGGC